MVAEPLPDALRLDDEVAQPRAGRQDDLRGLRRLLAALGNERLIGRDPRLTLCLARPPARPDPLQSPHERAPARALGLALAQEARLVLCEPARIIALDRNAAAAVEFWDPSRHHV